VKRELILVLLAAFLAGVLSCSPAQQATYEADKAKLAAWWQKNQPQVAAILGQVQGALDKIQGDYPFWSGLVAGTLRVAGVNVTQADMDKALPYIKMADSQLGILGKVVNKEKVGTGDLQNAIGATTEALPIVKKEIMANPAIAALYQGYMAGQANIPPPPQPPLPPAPPAPATAT
jgi:hypothetical protein